MPNHLSYMFLPHSYVGELERKVMGTPVKAPSRAEEANVVGFLSKGAKSRQIGSEGVLELLEVLALDHWLPENREKKD